MSSVRLSLFLMELNCNVMYSYVFYLILFNHFFYRISSCCHGCLQFSLYVCYFGVGYIVAQIFFRQTIQIRVSLHTHLKFLVRLMWSTSMERCIDKCWHIRSCAGPLGGSIKIILWDKKCFSVVFQLLLVHSFYF